MRLRKYVKRKENYSILRRCLQTCVRDRHQLTARELGLVRKVLASYVTRHGLPGSDRLRIMRHEQRLNVSRPPHHQIAGVLVQRLERFFQDEGTPDVHLALKPLSEREALGISCSPRAPVPKHLLDDVNRCIGGAGAI